jgi:hypothetical protein
VVARDVRRGSITRKSECITAVIVLAAASDGATSATSAIAGATAERFQREIGAIRSLLT